MAFLRSKKIPDTESHTAQSSQSMDGVLDYDIRGQICPSTLLTALQEINRRQEDLKTKGMTLSFHTDNRDAIATIPEAARNMGYQVDVVKRNGAYVVAVKSSQQQR